MSALGLALLLAVPLAVADAPREADALLDRAGALASPQQRRADLAVPIYRQAIVLAERTGDARRGARAWTGLGHALASLHHPREAREALERGRRLARESGEHATEGQALRFLGGLLVEQGDFEGADRSFAELLDLATRAGDRALRVRALNNLCANRRRQGRLLEAIAQARQALEEMDRELAAGREIPAELRFSVPYNLGRSLSDGGDYSAAIVHFERALEAARAAGLIAGVWHVLEDTALWYQAQGELAKAASYHERALAQARLMESRDPEAVTLRSLGSVAEARGDDRLALERYGEALAIFDRIGYGSELSQTLTAVSRVEARLGDAAGAAARLRQAVAFATRHGQMRALALARLEGARQETAAGRLPEAEAEYRAALRIARENGLRPLEPAALTGLAGIARRGGDLPQARRRYEESVAALERIRARVPGVEERAAFAAVIHETYDGLFDVLMEEHRRQPGGPEAREAFLVLERERTRNLMDALAQYGVDPSKGMASAQRAEEGRLHRLVTALQLQLLAPETDASARTELLARLDDAERALDALEGAAREKAPWTAPADLDALQSRLLPEEAFVAYAPRSSGIAVLLLTRDAFRAVDLPPLADLGSRVEFFARMLASPTPQEGLPAGLALSRSLLRPVLAELPPRVRRLILGTSGDLSGLPFGALPDPSRPEAPILSRLEIAYAPSLAALANLRSRPRGPRGLLAVGSPDRRLAASRREIEAIAGSVSAPVETLVGLKASESELKARRLRAFGVLHFATHAVVDPRQPSRSAILLRPGAGEDGRLQPREIYSLDLSADLIVLSACRTAAGRASAAEGMFSLARAFTYAGARAVLGSLFEVEDEAAARLMERFYSALAEGEPAAAALREAQLAAAGPNAYARAGEWAGFVLAGDPAVQPGLGPRRRRYGLRAAFFGLAAALLAAGGVWRLARARRRAA